jgi:hypothetical protein
MNVQKKSSMKPTHIFQFLLLIALLLAGSGYSQTANQAKPKLLSLLYSSNVLGEYEPCG